VRKPKTINVGMVSATKRFDKGEIDRKSMYMYKDNLRYFIEKYSNKPWNYIDISINSKIIMSLVEK